METDHQKAINAGERMAALLIEQGHDELGIQLSLAYFAEHIEELFAEVTATEPHVLARLALETACAELQRRKAH